MSALLKSARAHSLRGSSAQISSHSPSSATATLRSLDKVEPWNADEYEKDIGDKIVPLAGRQRTFHEYVGHEQKADPELETHISVRREKRHSRKCLACDPHHHDKRCRKHEQMEHQQYVALQWCQSRCVTRCKSHNPIVETVYYINGGDARFVPQKTSPAGL